MINNSENSNQATNKARRTFQDLCICFPELTFSMTFADTPKIHIQDEFGQKFSLAIDVVEESQNILHELIFSIKHQLQKFDA